MTEASPDFKAALLAGAAAGLAVDVSLFPLDTIKTRLQSAAGFYHSGGFRNIYSGLGSVIIGSCPGAATFFCTYESLKPMFVSLGMQEMNPLVHMLSASCGEVTACIVRVPTEVVKQRAQARSNASSWSILKETIRSEGVFGLYRGYLSTVLREIPFSFIQFPIWEYLKSIWSQKQGYYVKPWQSALCGGIAGGLAAALTTPIDVAKTRIMLASKQNIAAHGNINKVMLDVWKDKGLKGLFAGVSPRVLWISIGGIIFFGVYEKTKTLLQLIHL